MPAEKYQLSLYNDPCRSVSQGVDCLICLPKTAWPPTWHCTIFFTNAGRRYFFTIQDAFLVGVAVKIYNVGRLGFFVRAQPKL